MASISDPRAVSFANTKIRVHADQLRSVYWTAKSILASWVALNGATLIPNTGVIIVDGASVDGVGATGGDGRTLMTGAEMWTIINQAQSIVNFFEGSVQVAAGDGSKTRLNEVELIRVNGQALF